MVRGASQFAQRGLAAAVATLFVVAVVEMAFRLAIFPEYRVLLQEMYEPHPMLGHFNKPNLAVRRFSPMNYDVVNHTNALGLRGREAERERELAGVWVAGSSNTFGGYLEDDEVFAARLKADGYWAANLSSEGHNMPNQALVIRYLAGLGYRPRAVVLAIPMVHGIQDYDDKYGFLTRPLGASALAAGAEKPAPPSERLRRALAGLGESAPASAMALRARLIKSSALYGWLKVGIMGVAPLRDLTLKLGLRADVDLVYKQSLDLLRPPSPANPSGDQIRSTADYAAAIGALVKGLFRVPFGVVLLPYPHQLYPDRFRRFVAHHGLAGEDLDPQRPLAQLKQALKARGIPVLDPTPALVAANDRRLTFPDDAHLNATAHAIVAERVAEWLALDIGVPPAR